MDKKLSMVGAAVNLAGVLLFAVSMLAGLLPICYLSSIFIAWGLVLMNCGFSRFGRLEARAAALCALVFGGMYALCNTFVYFIQLTAVANDALSEEARNLLDYNQFGLMFDLDLLGYCLMAVSTLFAGLTIDVRDKQDKWLKALLMIHGIFAVTCFVMPMLGLFSTDMQGAEWIGTLILEFWCAYFIPVGLLSLRYFNRQELHETAA